MHIELVGCTSAGKTTLTRKLLSAAREQGTEIILGDDFVLEKLRLNHLKNEYLRRRLLEIYAAYICLRNWQKYRLFCSSAFGIIKQTAGSWFYKLNLVRIVLRKVGIFELIQRSGSEEKLFLVDNEGIVQAAHNLFVHTTQHLNGNLTNFVNSAPLPDLIVYLRQQPSVLVERTLRRGHPRIRHISQEKVRSFVEQAVELFESLRNLPEMAGRVLIIDDQKDMMTVSGPGNNIVPPQLNDLIRKTSAREAAGTVPVTKNPGCLTLIRELTSRLEDRHVEYCHWKSNINLEEGLQGDSDLDFFVSHESAPQLLKTLDPLGFKAAKLRYGPQTGGVTHHYGLDASSGKIVHLHLFRKVVTGESFVKSHDLPFEKMLLGNCDREGPVRVLAKEAELVIFIIRLFIKYGSLPDIIRLRSESQQLQRELDWLQDEDNVSKSLALLNEFCPAVSENLFLNCIEAIHENKSVLKRIRLARQLRKKLKPYSLYAYFNRLAAYAGVILAKLRCQVQGNKRNKTLNSGGAVIAIVGADATGKSTLVSETARWLGKIFAVRKVHVGKPPATLLTLPLNMMLPLSRRLFPRLRRSHTRAKTENQPDAAAAGEKSPASLFIAIRALGLAWDRNRLLRKVVRARSKGELIICDRYPSERTGAMDSPRLTERKDKKGLKIRLFNGLARMEKRLYDHMPPPDISVRLKVSLETAMKRNQAREKSDKDSDDFIEVRHQNAGEWYRAGTKHYFEIDTEQSIEATILDIKKVIWESL